MQLEQLVLVVFLKDEIIIPKESAAFGFYAPGGNTEIVKMQKTELYKKVLIVE